jgi:hypothetical protein
VNRASRGLRGERRAYREKSPARTVAIIVVVVGNVLLGAAYYYHAVLSAAAPTVVAPKTVTSAGTESAVPGPRIVEPGLAEAGLAEVKSVPVGSDTAEPKAMQTSSDEPVTAWDLITSNLVGRYENHQIR